MTNYIENIERSINAIDNGMTLKSDYSDELEVLDNIESNISVMRHLGTPVWKCKDLSDHINHLRAWIHEEEAAH